MTLWVWSLSSASSLQISRIRIQLRFSLSLPPLVLSIEPSLFTTVFSRPPALVCRSDPCIFPWTRSLHLCSSVRGGSCTRAPGSLPESAPPSRHPRDTVGRFCRSRCSAWNLYHYRRSNRYPHRRLPLESTGLKISNWLHLEAWNPKFGLCRDQKGHPEPWLSLAESATGLWPAKLRIPWPRDD